ncbi:DUF2905 family protein [Candidatus Paracaedibacter symbiosus]|uniref:DUF2905 family protein n=1 Tax=Candidatus Paracaedibacter symbiosus TaxID=244582 RepID=UPI0012EBC9A6
MIALSLILIIAGIITLYLGKLDIGRLPGDILLKRGNITFYFPIISCLILSIIISFILWFIRR